MLTPETTMTKLAVVFVVAVAVIGCKKKGADCDHAVTNMLEVQRPGMVSMGMEPRLIDKIKAIALHRCKEDSWPDDSMRCMTEAKSQADAETCQKGLPKEMGEKVKKEIDDASPPAGGDAGSAAPAAPAGSGSGSSGGSPPTGSAGKAPAGSGSG
jgi:hypothetical protein